MYYNTNKVSGELLEKYRQLNVGQDKEVYEVFLNSSREYMTSHDIEEVLARYPRSSIVRSCNSLMNRGLIVKTDNMVIGKYGKQCHTYKLVKEKHEQTQLFD